MQAMFHKMRLILSLLVLAFPLGTWAEEADAAAGVNSDHNGGCDECVSVLHRTPRKFSSY